MVHGLQTAIRKDLLDLGPLAATAPKESAGSNPFLNVSPVKLASAPPTPDGDLLLATLVPYGGAYGHKRLSVVALRSALRAGNSPANRYLAAFAALELGRRSYALKLLEGVQTPEAETLRELLNGNLPEAQQKLPAVTKPMARLQLMLEIQSLAGQYKREVTFDAKVTAEVFGSSAPAWQALVERRARDADTWKQSNSRDVKLRLDEAFPIEGLSLKSTVIGDSVVSGPRDIGDIDLANIRHVRAALAQLKPAACCSRVNASWRLYWFLESATEANLDLQLRAALHVQGQPATARALIEKYDSFYSGHPEFEIWRAVTASNLGARAPGDMARRYREEYITAEKSAIYWAQGQTNAAKGVTRSSEYLPLADTYSHDYPRRPDWPMPGWGDQGAAGRLGCVALENSTSEIEPVASCLEQTPSAEQPQLRASLQGRFHGHPYAKDFLGRGTVEPDYTRRCVGEVSRAVRRRARRLDVVRRAGQLSREAIWPLCGSAEGVPRFCEPYDKARWWPCEAVEHHVRRWLGPVLAR